tara:strand:+ start:871 stop:1932 length:1062 start_codon:yes stop_codon:yes gene_type:complete
MKKKNIIYLMPEIKLASGGAKVIYNHSSILNNLDNDKISSKIVHLKKKLSYKIETSLSKRINLFNKRYSGWDVKKMKVSQKFLPNKKWHNEDITLGKNLNFNKNSDFIILPEIWAHFAVDLGLIKQKIKYAIFVQGFYHMNTTNNYKKIKSAYKNANIIITVSEYSLGYLREMFPTMKKKIFKINFSLNNKKIKIKKKKNLITYMPRKLADHYNLLDFYLKDLLPKNWIIVPLLNLSEKKLFQILGESKIFLSFSHLEGTGIPPIEAALSGNKVIGYTGGGGSEYWKKPIFTKIENGEIRNFGKEVLFSIKNYDTNWVNKTKKHRTKLSYIYSAKLEKKSLINLSKEILKIFT